MAGQQRWLQRLDEPVRLALRWLLQRVGLLPQRLPLPDELLRQVEPQVQRAWLRLLHELVSPSAFVTVRCSRAGVRVLVQRWGVFLAPAATVETAAGARRRARGVKDCVLLSSRLIMVHSQ